MHFKASWAVFWSLSCYKEQKLTTKPFTCTVHTVCDLLIEMQNIYFWLGKFKHLGLKVTEQFWLWLFAFLASFSFSFAGHLVVFILLGKVFRKAFRILGLHESKGTWVVEQDFHGIFRQCNTVFCLFLRSPWLNCAHSGMNGLKDVFTLHKLAHKVVLDH